MDEELIISGRNIPHIDPTIEIWEWQIPLYLFLGGVAAGVLFFASLYYILGKEKEMPTTVKWASFVAAPSLVLGLFALFLDLKHKLFFWRLYTTIKFDSPMSWGAWTLLIITPLAFIWSASYIKELYPKWDWKYDWINKFEEFVISNRKYIAWILVLFAVILGIYTGILLSAFNARPLWNTSVLGMLFLTSGLSTGAAIIMWMSKDSNERKIISKIDLMLIGIELFLIIHLMMGLLAGPQVQVDAAKLFLGGPFTFTFWLLVVFAGMLVPAALEILELRGKKIPVFIPSLLILVGGLIFRYIMVEAGQISGYIF